MCAPLVPPVTVLTRTAGISCTDRLDSDMFLQVCALCFHRNRIKNKPEEGNSIKITFSRPRKKSIFLKKDYHLKAQMQTFLTIPLPLKVRIEIT